MQKTPDIAQRVKAIITEQLGTDIYTVRPEDELLNHLQFDSLDHYELMMAIELEFQIDLVDEQFFQLRTVQQVIDHITAICTVCVKPEAVPAGPVAAHGCYDEEAVPHTITTANQIAAAAECLWGFHQHLLTQTARAEVAMHVGNLRNVAQQIAGSRGSELYPLPGACDEP